VRLDEKIGFQVEVLNPNPTTEMVDMFTVSTTFRNGCPRCCYDTLFVDETCFCVTQIVPLGTDWAAATYYGQPAMKLGLKYMEYKIVPEESSL